MTKRYSISKTTPKQVYSKKTCKNHNLPILIQESKLAKVLVCQTCIDESKARLIQAFKNKASMLFNGYYDYSLVEFKNRSDLIKIICPIHGVYTKSVSKHLNGSECKLCANGNGGINKIGFVDSCNNSVGVLYVLLCRGFDEVFYKVGITSTTVAKRFCGRVNMPYEYDVVCEIKHDADAIFDLEKILHKMLYDFAYRPKMPFGGMTECFTTIEPIIDILNTAETA